MLSLTPLRFKKVQPILNRYRTDFQMTDRVDAALLEQELVDGLELGSDAIKLIMIDLISNRKYRLLAARYMEAMEPNVPLEFMIPLAKLYGITAYHSRGREEAKRAFWKQALKNEEQEY